MEYCSYNIFDWKILKCYRKHNERKIMNSNGKLHLNLKYNLQINKKYTVSKLIN